MSRKASIIAISVIIVISLIISIYIPNKEKIEEKEDSSIKYEIIEENGMVGISDGVNRIIEPKYDEIIIINPHRAVFLCRNKEKEIFLNQRNEEIFKEYDNVEIIEIQDSVFENNYSASRGGAIATRDIFQGNNIDGKLDVLVKTIGKRKALQVMLDDIVNNKDNIHKDCVMITHTYADEEASYLKEKLNELIPDAHVEITDAGCVISSHCGKGTIGILYIMK